MIVKLPFLVAFFGYQNIYLLQLNLDVTNILWRLMMRNNNQIKLKKKIYLSRTYRRLKVDRVSQNLYLFLWVIPCLFVFLYAYSKITFYLTDLAYLSLSSYLDINVMGKELSNFLPYFGGIYYLTIPDALPDNKFIAVNMMIALSILFICVSGNRSGHPIMFTNSWTQTSRGS